MIIIYLLISFPSSINSDCLMNMSFSKMPPEKYFQFESSGNGFHTVHGYFNDKKWYRKYRVKVRIPLFSNFHMDYKYFNEEYSDYIYEESHLFKFHWIPDRTNLPVYYSAFISPPFSGEKGFYGFNFGYWKDNTQNHAISIALENIEQNHELSEIDDSLDNTYRRVPVILSVKGIILSSWADLTYKYSYNIAGKRDLYTNGALIRREEYPGMELKLNSRYRLSNWFQAGIQIHYQKSDTNIYSPSSMPVDSIQHINLYGEPYIFVNTVRGKIHFSLPLCMEKTAGSDNNYERKWAGFNFEYKYQLKKWIDLSIGFQKIWRNFDYSNNIGPRITSGFDIYFSKKTYMKLRKGFEFHSSQEFYNHTFFTISHLF